MDMYFYIVPSEIDATHHGVLGMKWGVRRHQPYSVVPRGSGKGGKEIGAAAKYDNEKIKKALNNPNGYKNPKNTKPYDFYDSEDSYKASGKAYDKTVDWFKKNEPEFLESIIKKDGKNADFRMYHDFRKTYEGFESEELYKAEKEWNKKRDKNSESKRKDALNKLTYDDIKSKSDDSVFWEDYSSKAYEKTAKGLLNKPIEEVISEYKKRDKNFDEASRAYDDFYWGKIDKSEKDKIIKTLDTTYAEREAALNVLQSKMTDKEYKKFSKSLK